jgi:23S rRNA-/tRNA-specific pseudouridylate synthase
LHAQFQLKIIKDSADYYVIEKPIAAEMRTSLAAKFSLFSPIYSLEPEESGIILCAKNKLFYNELRNFYGSEKITFNFTIFARNNDELGEEIICDLPIAQHRERDCMIISHSTGKKAKTIFKKLENLRQFTLWSAETRFLRKHQIRLHAHEVGIAIFGEDLYNKTPVPFLSDFKSKVKTNRKGISTPLYPAICIHLSTIKFPHGGENVTIETPLPGKFTSMLKIIQKWN